MLNGEKNRDRTVHDVIVVGAGVTGSWAAKELTEAGLRVCLLDAGPWSAVPAASGEGTWTEQRRRTAAQRQPVQSQHPAFWQNDPTHFVDDFDHPYTVTGDGGFNWIRGRQVGGRSLTWGGVTLRLSDFELLAAERDGFGPTWPLSYRELQPFYERVERYHGVQGACDGLQGLPDGAFQAPCELTPLERAFQSAVASHWTDRTAIRCRAIPERDDAGGAVSPRTMMCRTLPDAMRTGRLSLRPDSIVVRLITDPRRRDRVLGVECIHRVEYTRFQCLARIVVLCASTIESVRILLNSAGEGHPGGLGNSSGLLGRCFMDHAACWAVGYVPGVAPQREHPLPVTQGLLIPRFRNMSESHPDFIRGYGVWANVGVAAWGATEAPMWSMCAMLEVLPRESNCVGLDRTVTDQWGVPTASIHLTYSENEMRMLEDAQESIRQTSTVLGWPLAQSGSMVPGTFAHELGGARMGRDPRASVLSPFNQCWDVSNLFVLDGACFTTSAWQNPTLTMMALTVRACEFIVREHALGLAGD